MPKERNLSDLKQLLNVQMANIRRDVGRLTIEVGQKILQEVVKRTPVDTSNALSNWQVQLGTLNGTLIAPYFAGEKGSTFGQSSLFATQIGQAKMDAHKVGEAIFIFNCVDYITDLEQGSSPQRPEGGFVKQAIMSGRIELEERVKSWQKKRL